MRKLFTAAASFSAAIYAAHYLLPRESWIYLALACAALSAMAFFVARDLRVRVITVCLSFAIGIGVYSLHYGAKVLPSKNVSELDTEISAVITDYPTELKDSYTSVPIRLTDSKLPRLNALLYSYSDDLSGLSPGDEISAYVRIRPSDTRYGESYERYMAENIFFLCYIKGDVEVTGKSAFSFFYFPNTIAKMIRETAQLVFSDVAAPLMTALLTGDKTALYEDRQFYADMAETGVLHVVAVSGMHLAFLVGFIKLTVRRKKTVSLIAIPLLWIFVSVAGAPASVIRAAFMYSMVLIAPLIKRESDGMTSMFAILAILLMFNPLSCASVGLQLSFSAMLGMMTVAPRVYKGLSTRCLDYVGKSKNKTRWQSLWQKLIFAIFASFSSTIGALAFSTPVAALHFGYVSIIGIIVNILIFAFVSVGFILGYIACIAGLIWLPIGAVLGAITDPFVYIMMGIIRLGAKIPYAAVYIEGSFFNWWLVLLYVVFIVCYLSRGKRGFRPYIPVCLAVSSLCALIIFYDLRMDLAPDMLKVMDVGQGQSLILTSGRHTALIDCGGKGKLSNAGDTIAARLLSEGRRSLDLLAITHFDDDHVNGVIRLMSRVEVKRIVIPANDLDKRVAKEILEYARLLDIAVYSIGEDSQISVGEMGLSVFVPDNEKQDALIYLGNLNGFEFMVTGDLASTDERRLLKRRAMPDIDLLVAGHHGSKHSNSDQLISALKAKYAAVSSGYNNYGHPTQEALLRFERGGMEVFRTDQHGDITFYIN